MQSSRFAEAAKVLQAFQSRSFGMRIGLGALEEDLGGGSPLE